MNPSAPDPTVADDRSVSPLARRLGPPLAAGALVLTGGLLAWLGLAPTAIAGPLDTAPFEVPGLLAVGPDPDGCIRFVDGSGSTAQEVCDDDLAQDGHGWSQVAFTDDDLVQVAVEDGETRTVLVIDPATGDVRDRRTGTYEDDPRLYDEPGQGGQPEGPPSVYASGDTVRRLADSPTDSPDDAEIVLDLDAPPGWTLHDAALSPDQRWVVVLTPDDRIAVAPVDGSAPPHVWAATPPDQWVDLRTAIRWAD